MNEHSNIVVYGHDSVLLETRAKILERSGYTVLRVSQIGALKEALLSQPFGLLVLCHTLSRDEHEHALQVATSTQPAMKRLLITTQKTETPGQTVELMSNSAGPQALVTLANAMMATARTASR